VGIGRSEICWAVVTPDDRFAFTTNFADEGRVPLCDCGRRFALAGGCDGRCRGRRHDRAAPRGPLRRWAVLYVTDADGGRIYAWSIGAAGALEPVGSWEGLPATVAGLAAR
jgi:hypothetical protein